MIYLQLFLVFLQIGAFSFGGGYGMISVIREQCLSYGWLTEEELINFIAVAESTPGPIAVNMATFVGSSQGGIIGSLAATLGVVLPSFVIILLIAAVFKNLMKYKGVIAALDGVQPVIIGLITATGITMLLSMLTGIFTVSSAISFDWKSTAIFLLLCASSFVYKKIKKKSASPIALIVLSAVLGIIFFGILQ